MNGVTQALIAIAAIVVISFIPATAFLVWEILEIMRGEKHNA